MRLSPDSVLALLLFCLAFFGLGGSFWAVSGGIGDVCFWEPFNELLLRVGIFRVTGKILPFKLICIVVVEFFCSVAVSDVSESFGAEGVVVSSVGC